MLNPEFNIRHIVNHKIFMNFLILILLYKHCILKNSLTLKRLNIIINNWKNYFTENNRNSVQILTIILTNHILAEGLLLSFRLSFWLRRSVIQKIFLTTYGWSCPFVRGVNRSSFSKLGKKYHEIRSAIIDLLKMRHTN